MECVAVTGAAGRVGSHVLEERDARYTVTPVDRHGVSGYETTIADVTEYDEVAEALEGHDTVVHLAAESASRVLRSLAGLTVVS